MVIANYNRNYYGSGAKITPEQHEKAPDLFRSAQERMLSSTRWLLLSRPDSKVLPELISTLEQTSVDILDDDDCTF